MYNIHLKLKICTSLKIILLMLSHGIGKGNIYVRCNLYAIIIFKNNKGVLSIF